MCYSQPRSLVQVTMLPAGISGPNAWSHSTAENVWATKGSISASLRFHREVFSMQLEPLQSFSDLPIWRRMRAILAPGKHIA